MLQRNQNFAINHAGCQSYKQQGKSTLQVSFVPFTWRVSPSANYCVRLPPLRLLMRTTAKQKETVFGWNCGCYCNLVPRAHVSFGQRQDTELWNNPFQESKILGLPVSRSMRALALKRRPEVKSMWIRSTKAFNMHSHRLYL